MAKPLARWVEEDVGPYRDRDVRWLSEHFFFRDPARATYADRSVFLSPADGVILYQGFFHPEHSLLDIKGKSYSLRDALGKPKLDRTCAVVGIFLTFYDVHTQRVPYPGTLEYRQLDEIVTQNRPMLEVEHDLIEALKVPPIQDFHRTNQRAVNTFRTRDYSDHGQFEYYVLQIADYDVDCIVPFELDQHEPAFQGERFGQIRYGSQVDLVVPFNYPEAPPFQFVQEVGFHVEAGVDPLLRLIPE
jgi:phosphatidylserine decarboxylase